MDNRDDDQRRRDSTLEGQLRNDRSPHEPEWRDLDDYIRPGRLRLATSDANRANKRPSRIINNTGFVAYRTARSGLHSGMTSPARPWFMTKAPDPELSEYGPVKAWHYVVTQRMGSILLRSNIYNALPTLYGDEIQFGFGAMGIFEDDQDLMRAYTFAPGTYWMAQGERMVVDTFLREVPLTVRQVLERYGDKGKAGTASFWEPFSKTIKSLADSNNLESRLDVMQIITPNAKWDRDHYEAKYKAFRSCHYEKGGDHGYLRESGFDEFPIMCPRWDVAGEDVYGRGLGIDVLGDIKALQLYERRHAQALEKQINPPLTGPASLANRKVSLLPADITAIDVREGMQGLKAIHETRASLADVERKIAAHERRIDRGMYADLFLRFIMDDRAQRPTARQVDEEAAEKLTELGPVLERQNDELFDPLIGKRLFNMMVRAGLIPPRPPELEDVPLSVDYVSVMAQAQKLIGSVGLERVSGYVGNISAAIPEAADNFDSDQAIRNYADMYGTAPNVIRSPEAVAEMRQRRMQEAQAAAAAERATQVAEGAKTLSETDVGTDSALTALLGGEVAV